MDKIVELSVENFKAVKKADITLNGITVVSGINGCGKSSLSQLLYYSFYYANRYDEMVDENLNICLSKYLEVLKQIIREIHQDSSNNRMEGFTAHYISVRDKQVYMQYIKELVIIFLQYESFINQKGNQERKNSFNRVIRIVQDVLNESSDNVGDLLNRFQNNIELEFENALRIQEYRVYPLLEERLNLCLKRELPDKWTIQEYNVPFAGTGTNNVPLLHYIKRAAYIDTPMVIGNQLVNGKDYWVELGVLLNGISHVDKKSNLYKSLLQIMNGESIVEEDGIRDFKLSYRRNDGKIFDLKDCATGIKSFSILQLLLKNGFLQKDTLLIVDEPEAHLHPQWIVEYARMIVLLHKEIGVKFFIASHSTDMISAIRYIAAKEAVQDSLNFYLAEDSAETPYEYTYRALGLDIDPIFKSFNKSFEKIDEYGAFE